MFELTSYLGLFAVSFGAATLLPDDQDALINAIAEVNATTVVVLQSGGPVTMPWLSRVPAVLAAWYPGSGGGGGYFGCAFWACEFIGSTPRDFSGKRVAIAQADSDRSADHHLQSWNAAHRKSDPD